MAPLHTFADDLDFFGVCGLAALLSLVIIGISVIDSLLLFRRSKLLSYLRDAFVLSLLQLPDLLGIYLAIIVKHITSILIIRLFRVVNFLFFTILFAALASF